jgi:hypothetical protein
MFEFKELGNIQIEITNRCQVSCPMCPRNIHGGIENPLLKINDWSYQDFVNIFNKEVLDQITAINFCGDFGDPILNSNLPAMCQYLKTNSPNIRVLIHTNGSARSSNWWKLLANSMPHDHSIIFALDGLEDTHHLYRVGSNFNTILKNTQTFINEGGIAEWCFIRFKHNQHQVEQARALSKDLGFKYFTVKNSKRFSRPFPVVDKQGNKLYNIEQPSDNVIKFVGKKELEGHANWPNSNQITCMSIRDKELYIDANYLLSPCCMIGAFLYTNYDADLYKKYDLYTEDSIIDEGFKVQQQIFNFVKELGNINVLEKGLKNIIDTDLWQMYWHNKWGHKQSPTCIVMCSPNMQFNPINNQKVNV